MANEKITEAIVRKDLENLGYYTPSSSTCVEEAQSQISLVKKHLRFASKTGKRGRGAPEFIITDYLTPDFVIVIECKASTRFHQSATGNKIAHYAVDGALHYANHLSKGMNVIAIAISGQSPCNLKFSAFLHTKNETSAKQLTTKDGAVIDKLIPWEDFIEHATFDPTIQKLRYEELMAFSKKLHEFMRDHAKLTESEKPLLVSGTLIALQNKAFAKSFDEYQPAELQKQWLKVIKDEIAKAIIPQAKKYNMTQPYSTIAVHPELGKPRKKYPRGVLFEIIQDLNEKVWPFISIYHDFDIVGQFYGEFLKYTGGDKKALGIVLTPRHITDLFSRLANVHEKSTVLDICAGTGGFLVSAMHHMMKYAQTSAEKDRIKKEGLIGVEHQPNMYALAASNMILRGDGKANLHQGSCFDSGIEKQLVKYNADVGMLNPPFSQSDEDLHELVFINQMLKSLRIGGTGIAIVPMSCAIAPHPMRETLMKNHTLEAVMSMPDDLFYPVGTVTCIMVWTAKVPHIRSRKKTWFGYWKNDGFIKTKHKGRIDERHKWPSIRETWLTAFANREKLPGFSVLKQVSHEDEWCAEAYIETDYDTLSTSEFEKVVRDYLVFHLQNTQITHTRGHR